jgi:hypothetical protein
MSETALASKLAAKGVLPRNVKFQLALAEFQNNGGEYGVALAMLNAAYGRGAKVGIYSPDGLAASADASLTDAAKGHTSVAGTAAAYMPNAAPSWSAGHGADADKATAEVPAASPHKPGHARRGIAAIGSVQSAVAQSLFDTTRLPDGRSLREVHWAEVPRLAQRYTFLSRVMLIVHRKAVPADPAATLDQIVSETELNEIIGSVERLNDIY